MNLDSEMALSLVQYSVEHAAELRETNRKNERDRAESLATIFETTLARMRDQVDNEESAVEISLEILRKL